jgi:hypothetical protein
MLLVAQLPESVSKKSLAYLALFRPGRGRGLIWSKALRLLSELSDRVRDPFIQWDGKPARPNSPEAWAEAMERVIVHPPPRLPLKSHGYLQAIAYEVADAMDQRAEVFRHRQEASGAMRTARGKAEPEPILTVDEMRKIRSGNFPKKMKKEASK